MNQPATFVSPPGRGTNLFMRLSLWLSIALLAAACGSKSKTNTTSSAAAGDPAAQMVQDLAGLHIDRLGNPVLRWDHIPPVLAKKERPHKLLVLLVEYQDRKFDRFAGDPKQKEKLAAYYQEQLFDQSYGRVDTLSHYYANQSLGQYHVIGEVLKPITLPQNAQHYGSPHRPVGGNWRNDAAPEGLVADALAAAQAAYKDMNWSDFDRWDPEDYDGDKLLDEGDGYLDHFVVVFAGGGQSSCEGLHKVGDVLTPNVQMEDGLKLLSDEQRKCADRIWPHRSKAKANDGLGPTLAGTKNRGGGIPVSDSLWIRDYNMQSEYTGASTFIHEFGHSIGLPDVYSRTSSNSTGGWEVMSGTASPSPQNLSSWSRLMLGWLKPEVYVPPRFGGKDSATITLRTLDDPAGVSGDGSRAAMIVLPPKEKRVELTALPPASGSWALYSGQGNELNRKALLDIDLSKASGAVELSFDAWWEIEPGWDFAYLEVSGDGGLSWTRKLPTEAAHMPAKHGHDGKTTLPGFTGLSGDLDGDGKNESNADCDPKAELPHGEDKDAANLSPCLKPSWVKPAFDLSDMAGKQVQVRLRYYTDGAAVMRGMLIDNVQVSGLTVNGDFEDTTFAGWTLDGFSRSGGSHDLLVPHFYLVEYRDPYAKAAQGEHRYDSALAKSGTLFYADPTGDDMMAVQVHNRPGVVLWYYNGAYAWSENDPSINGPGKGYLLVVDGDTSELKLPGLDWWWQGSKEANDTHYAVKDEAAQTALENAYARTVCFVRSPSYLPKEGVSADNREDLKCGAGPAAVAKIEVDGKPLRYSYEVYNELLPGKAREAVSRAGELFDTRKKDNVVSWRLRDRALRSLHTKDAPLSAEPFENAVKSYKVTKDGLVPNGTQTYAAQSTFTDKDPARYLNKKLPFGGVALPSEGLSLKVSPTRKDDAGHTLVDVELTWEK
jgi:bacillopeptidase F (M6 metalloprotease family)